MVVVVVLALVLLVVVGLVVLALVAAMAVGDLLAVVTAVVEVLVDLAVPAAVAGELAAVAFLSEPTMALHLKPGDSTLVHQAVLLLLLLLLSRDLRHLLALELLSKSVQSLLYQPAQVVLQQHDVALLHLQSYFEVLHAVVLIDEAHSQWHDVIAVHLPQCFQWHHVIVVVVGHHHRLHPLGLKFVFSYDDDDDDAPDYYFGHYFDLVH
mmetsp:Transcript_30434/g.52108  ORF Transcript_30434/g.52108 Transcript_30434/m.52108 type:complete len:209 (+) Transcript_30434:452-1078(+)